MFTSTLGNNVPGHTIRERPQVGFELVTNDIIANLDKTSLKTDKLTRCQGFLLVAFISHSISAKLLPLTAKGRSLPLIDDEKSCFVQRQV